MITETIKNVVTKQLGLSTYKTGLLHAKSYRILKNKTSFFLEPFDMSTIDWALLGLLFEQKEGLRLITIAETLGVEAPFITAMVDELEEKGYVSREADTKDKRAKIIKLTLKGRTFVPKIESDLRIEMKGLLKGLSLPDILGYLKVMESIIANSKHPAT
jgi:DNA-binding MarR family transcriptional regulator